MARPAALIVLLILVFACGRSFGADIGTAFEGQDLHIQAGSMIVCDSRCDGTDQLIAFEDRVSMQIGDNQLKSDRALVWIWVRQEEYLGNIHSDCDVQVYLEGGVSMTRGDGAKTTRISRTILEQGNTLVGRLLVSGQVFITTDQQTSVVGDNFYKLELYQRAAAALKPVKVEAKKTTKASPDAEATGKEQQQPAKPEIVPPVPASPQAAGQPEQQEVPSLKEPTVRYPVNFVGLWDQGVDVRIGQEPDGTGLMTITGRFYLWQRVDQAGGLMEFEADGAVVFYDRNLFSPAPGSGTGASGSVEAVYFRGNIVMTEDGRTIRADEMYYDFRNHRAIVVNAEMRTFSESRHIPIYIRAAKLSRLGDRLFKAEDVTITTSEFYVPQISLHASRLILTDTTTIDERTSGITGGSREYDGLMTGVSMRAGKTTFFRWPKIRTDFERPDTAIRSARFGNSSNFGTSIETQWYLDRLLGLKPSKDTSSLLDVDYFSERGPAAGLEVDYHKPDYYGRILGYMIDDHGRDTLGRIDSRRNIEPDQDLRGWFAWQQKYSLPDQWQLTTELSYLSDRNFLESFFRDEFNTEKEQETLIQLKKLQDNWGFAIMAKWRINDFQAYTEELPSAQFHLTGQSLWDDRLTYYGDSYIGRLRDRAGQGTHLNEEFYNLAHTRHEADMPFMLGAFKFVPFTAGTVAYEDGRGFGVDLDGHAGNPEDTVALGELGIRASTMFWGQDQYVRSRLWDLNGIRHILVPHAEAVLYGSGDETFDMRDIVNLGLSQRWQTRRLSGGRPETGGRPESVDWMRLDLDATFVQNQADDAIGPAQTYGPAYFIFNKPYIPVAQRRRSSYFGLVRDTVTADYSWYVSETMALLGDMNYDMRDSRVQQLDIGISRYVYPDVSYYIGSRYLRPVIIDIPGDSVYEKGSSALVSTITYAINQRYTISFSQEYNFDYGKSLRNELTIIRKYHRLYYGLSFSVDSSLLQNSVTFSIWPEGIKELGIGRRRHFSLVAPPAED